jgi:hypothetical protein
MLYIVHGMSNPSVYAGNIDWIGRNDSAGEISAHRNFLSPHVFDSSFAEAQGWQPLGF